LGRRQEVIPTSCLLPFIGSLSSIRCQSPWKRLLSPAAPAVVLILAKHQTVTRLVAAALYFLVAVCISIVYQSGHLEKSRRFSFHVYHLFPGINIITETRLFKEAA